MTDGLEHLEEQSALIAEKATSAGVVHTEKIIGDIGLEMKKAQGQTVEASIVFDGDIYRKLSTGGWHGPGGSYGPTTELGKKLEATLEEQRGKEEDSKNQEQTNLG